MATVTSEQRVSALDRAVNGTATGNYQTIFAGFADKGIPVDQIEPRVNVLTYNAWQAKGRQVVKGSKGVKVMTFVPCKSKEINPETGKKDTYKRMKAATVFHVTQTELIAQ